MQTYIEETLKSKELGEKFKKEIKHQGRSLTWMAAQMQITVVHLQNILVNYKEKNKITEKNRQKMNELLSTDY